jgi:DNA-binding response OmpR family regulator
MAPSVQASSAMQTPPSNTNAPRRQRLLVGQKNPTLRDFVASVLSVEGHEVVGVSTGIDLVDAVSVSLHPEFGSGAFALVIAETSLLHEAELQAFNRLADWARLPPFIFIASFGDKAVRAKVEPFETVAVFEQPLDIVNLRHRVNTFLRRPPRDDRSLQTATHS